MCSVAVERNCDCELLTLGQVDSGYLYGVISGTRHGSGSRIGYLTGVRCGAYAGEYGDFVLYVGCGGVESYSGKRIRRGCGEYVRAGGVGHVLVAVKVDVVSACAHAKRTIVLIQLVVCALLLHFIGHELRDGSVLVGDVEVTVIAPAAAPAVLDYPCALAGWTAVGSEVGNCIVVVPADQCNGVVGSGLIAVICAGGGVIVAVAVQVAYLHCAVVDEAVLYAGDI